MAQPPPTNTDAPAPVDTPRFESSPVDTPGTLSPRDGRRSPTDAPGRRPAARRIASSEDDAGGGGTASPEPSRTPPKKSVSFSRLAREAASAADRGGRGAAMAGSVAAEAESSADEHTAMLRRGSGGRKYNSVEGEAPAGTSSAVDGAGAGAARGRRGKAVEGRGEGERKPEDPGWVERVGGEVWERGAGEQGERGAGSSRAGYAFPPHRER